MGTLTDEDITELAAGGDLITSQFEPANAKQACYELRASNIFYETASAADNKRVESNAGYILRPHTFVTCIVMERISLDPDIVARVLAKGQLFSVGIVPVNTYGDPGFKGRLGITLYNSSHRHLKITPGQSIAKIEFTRLPKSVLQPYSGQHGFESEMWPIPTQLYASSDDLKNGGIDPRSVAEINRSYGPIVASLEARLSFYEYKVWIQIAITVFFFGSILAVHGHIEWFTSIVLGVLGNLVTNLALFCSRKLPLQKWLGMST